MPWQHASIRKVCPLSVRKRCGAFVQTQDQTVGSSKEKGGTTVVEPGSLMVEEATAVALPTSVPRASLAKARPAGAHMPSHLPAIAASGSLDLVPPGGLVLAHAEASQPFVGLQTDSLAVFHKLDSLLQVLDQMPLCQRLSFRRPWWVQHASPDVVQLLDHGVSPGWETPPQFSVLPTFRSEKDVTLANSILQDYLQVGAVRQYSWKGQGF